MSKQSYITRYLLIIKKIKLDKYCTYNELTQYLQYQSGRFLDEDIDFRFSKRTLQRDIREIRTLFNVDIEYSKAKDSYFISNEPDNDSYFLQLADYSNFLNTLNYANLISQYIAFERREDKGSQLVPLFLKAIHNRKRVAFDYHKYTENKTTRRKIDPLGLKEHRGRWYIVAKDTTDHAIKSFGLDRINNLEITNELFDYPKYFTLNDYFKYSFGIYRPIDQEPEEIILSFKALKGQYIKAYPLHHTQQLISETQNEVVIKLCLYITSDFVMELMSHSNEIKVISPKHILNPIL